MKNYMKVAHRSNTMSSYIENTVDAYKASILNDSVSGMEIDIQLTSDNKFVLMNYLDISDVLIGSLSSKSINDFTYEELSKLTLRANPNVIKGILDNNGSDFENFAKEMVNYANELSKSRSSIALLDDILKLDRNGKSLTIEIKDVLLDSTFKQVDYANRLVDLCGSYDMSNVTFISRNIEFLNVLKNICPYFTCLPVIGSFDIDKFVNDLDGAALAEDVLVQSVPGSDLFVHEYLKNNSNLITQVWNVDTPKKARFTDDVMGDYEYTMVSDKPELLDSYLDESIKRK